LIIQNRPRRTARTFQTGSQTLGRTYNGSYKRVTALTTALIVKRLGSNKSVNSLYKAVRKNCVHLRFLGRKLYRKFAVTKKINKNGRKQRNLANRFVIFVLKSLLSCDVVNNSSAAGKLKRALKNASQTGKSSKIVKKTLKLVKSFKAPSLKAQNHKKTKKNLISKPAITKTDKKNVKKAIKKMEKTKNLGKQLVKAQKKCREKGFQKGSKHCNKAKKLGKKYRKKTQKIKKVLSKNCRELKVQCFRKDMNCKKMFKICKKAKTIKKKLRSAKAEFFARVFAKIVEKLN